MSNYTYDENQSAGHGFSFSLKPGFEGSSPRLHNFNAITERSHESSINQKGSLASSSLQKARAFNLAPELTLDDLREKLKNDDFKVKKAHHFEDSSSLSSSLYKVDRPIETRDLLSSMSSHYLDRSGNDKYRGNNTDRHYGIKDTPLSRPQEEIDSNRPPYKNSTDPFPWETKLSSSPHATSLSSNLKSPLKYSYGGGSRDSSLNRYSNQPVRSAYPFGESLTHHGRNENLNPLYSVRDDIKSQFSKSRSPTPTKGTSPLRDLKGNSQYLGSSYFGSSNYSNKDLQQDLKEKIEQFNKKLAEVQEEFSQSKASQDPYKISLHSMKMLPKDDIGSELASGLESENKKAPYKGFGDENIRNKVNKDDKDKPLQIDNLATSDNPKVTGNKNSSSSYRRDYTQGFKDMKLRYRDMFLPSEMKTMTNPYKILKQRHGERLDKTVKGCIEETAALNYEIEQNLFNSNKK